MDSMAGAMDCEVNHGGDLDFYYCQALGANLGLGPVWHPLASPSRRV